ncbi:hypothetical protein [Paludisphaera mucosa]|uniref:Lipoprotein n=1 Tax=Paludisphaera mucosa TaxID=3030827 RepID=A0ABT6FIL4_9BACT|nr:hypothetical protein [Paludisphaera mucosa]MDG3007428.1 hypothetical protein [Paludisphaera mucosa]
MRRLAGLLVAILFLAGCATTQHTDVGEENGLVDFLRGPLGGAHWGPWTPEFAPDSTTMSSRRR